MNNFALNNTSVYLGGQCQWDIIVNKNKNRDQLKIDGFQLSPISDGVSYNRKGSIGNLNNSHSDTIKKYYGSLQESFWDVRFSPDTNILNDKNFISYQYDSSLLSGLKRISNYEIYKKQYCFFQPLWFESIPMGSSLRFKFTVHPQNNQSVILGAKTLDMSLREGDEYSFHNKFIKYLNDWFGYLNITSPVWKYIIDTDVDDEDKYIEYNLHPPLATKDSPEYIKIAQLNEPNDSNISYEYYKKIISDNKGNDRVMYMDLRNKESYISGVSLLTGQINNEVNCNYVISNLLLNERPNIETDYILSTLFKSHNMITSQLFNFNFCFDLEDILDDFIFQQLYGQNIYVSCDVWLIDKDGNVSSINKKTLFTNYEYIKKSTYHPFVFLDGLKVETTGRLTQVYTESPLSGQEIPNNVLNYLKDNEVPSVKDSNKLTQNICHWNYTGKKDWNFNLYNGYQYIYCDFGDIDKITPTGAYSNQEYQYYPREIKYSNDISIPSLTNTCVGNGELTWIYPKHILYINSIKNKWGTPEEEPSTWRDNLNYDLVNKIFNKGTIGPLYLNSLSIDEANATWGTNIQIDDSITSNINRISCIYVKTNEDDCSWADVKEVFSSLYNNVIVYEKNENNVATEGVCFVVDSGITGVIYTNIPECLLLENLIKKFTDAQPPASVIDQHNLSKIKNLLNKIKESITVGNDGEFYQFGKELCVGSNDLNELQYYKSDSILTHVYRISGGLTPAFLDDDLTTKLNYNYCLDIQDQTIQHLPSFDESLEKSFKIPFEISLPLNEGRRVFLSQELDFIVTKDILDNDTSLGDLIKEQLKIIYHLNGSDGDYINYVANEIYKLYFVSFDYEYIYYDKDEDNNNIVDGITKYTVKLILR